MPRPCPASLCRFLAFPAHRSDTMPLLRTAPPCSSIAFPGTSIRSISIATRCKQCQSIPRPICAKPIIALPLPRVVAHVLSAAIPPHRSAGIGYSPPLHLFAKLRLALPLPCETRRRLALQSHAIASLRCSNPFRHRAIPHIAALPLPSRFTAFRILPVLNLCPSVPSSSVHQHIGSVPCRCLADLIYAAALRIGSSQCHRFASDLLARPFRLLTDAFLRPAVAYLRHAVAHRFYTGLSRANAPLLSALLRLANPSQHDSSGFNASQCQSMSVLFNAFAMLIKRRLALPLRCFGLLIHFLDSLSLATA